MFQRLNRQAEYPGSGIGLAVTKKIVEIHQGEIFVVASENSGAAFHVILPAKQKI